MVSRGDREPEPESRKPVPIGSLAVNCPEHPCTMAVRDGQQMGRRRFVMLRLCRILDWSLMHDQLKSDCLARRNNDILSLTADTLYGIAASGHVEDGVSKIIR